MTGRLRTRRTALTLGVLGSGLALLVLTLGWARLGAGSLPASRLTGRQVAPGAFALALAALAGCGAVLLLGRTGRRVAGVLLVLLGAGMVVTSVIGARALADRTALPDAWTGAETITTWPWWSVAVAVGGLLVSGCGLLVVLDGPGWAETADRYTRAGRPADTDLWRALDEGRDPTADEEGPRQQG